MTASPLVLLSLTNIRMSNVGMGSRCTLELVYGLDRDTLTMRRTLCLRERSGEQGGKGLEIHVLEGRVVHVRETVRDAILETRIPRTYEFPWDQPQPLTCGDRTMGTITPMDEAGHAARLHLASDVVLEMEAVRYTRCWHCLTAHRVRTDHTVCGHLGCRAILPRLTIPFSLKETGFVPIERSSRRVQFG